jgi:hypothetical protein
MTVPTDREQQVRQSVSEGGKVQDLHFRARVMKWIRTAWVPIVLVCVASVSGGIVTANHSDQLAPFDEWVYYDYVLKVPTQGIVRTGEYIGHDALEAMACDGDSFGPRGEACNNVQDIYSNYPQQGKTSADLYTPLYFGITWVLGKAVQFATGSEFLTAARATGIFWLVGGLLVFYKLLELLKVQRVVSLGLGLAIIGAPTTFWANTYISTDAPVFLIGSALLLAGVGAVMGRTSPWWLVPIAIVGILFKVTTVLALGLVALFIVLFVLASRKTLERIRTVHLLSATAVAVAGALVAQVGWLVLRSRLAVAPGPDQGLATDFLWRNIVGQLSLFLNPGALGGGYDPLLRLPAVLGQPLVLLTVAGVVAFACMKHSGALERSLAIATMVAATVFAPLLAVSMYFVLGDVFPVIARYAIALLPALFVAAAMIVKNVAAQWIVVAYGGILVVTVTTCAVLFG